MRDYMILGQRVPFFSRRVRHLLPMCASHDQCPLTVSLGDEAFYVEAERRLEAERRRFKNRLWRLPNLAGRTCLDWLKKRGLHCALLGQAVNNALSN